MSQSSKQKIAFWIIFSVVFVDLLGFGIVFPLLPQYAREFNISESQVGWMLGIYSLMQFVFAPLLGQLSDRIGRRPVLLVSILGTALSFLMLAWAKTFWWFFIARAFDGIAGSNIGTAQAYIADLSPKEERTRNLGMWIGAAFGLGFAFGPFFGGVLYWVGQTVWPDLALSFPFLAAGLLALCNVVFAFMYLKESLPLKDSQHKVGQRTLSFATMGQHISGALGPLMLVYATIIFGFALMESSITWFAKDFIGLSTKGIYIFFGYIGIVVAFTQGGLVRRLAPRLGDRKLALIGCVLMVVGLAALPLYPSVAWLYAMAGLLSIGQSLCQPSLLSSISKGATDQVQGATMGVTQSFASLARFVGPVCAGYAYQHYGLQSPYFLASGIIFLAMGGVLMGFKRLGHGAKSAVKPATS